MTLPISAPHTLADDSVARIMYTVMIALLPATAFGIYLYGWPALNLFLITITSAIVCEALSLRIMGKPLRPSLADGSALLTGWLLAMGLPPWAPWWIGVVGGAFAIIVGKQIFGGIGQNVFNPAILARVALLVSFPFHMTVWVEPKPLFSDNAPGFLEGLAITFNGIDDVDSISSASPLGHVKTALDSGSNYSATVADHYDPLQALLGVTAGSLGETSALLLILGGLWLLWKRIISWHIPAALLGSLTLLATLFHLIDPDRYADPSFHLLSGGVMLVAIFFATDPVTSPNSTLGKLLFGAGCGLLIFAIRTWGSYPEGVGFAVLLMNALTPIIDHYIRPRRYGRNRNGKPLPVPAPSTTERDKEQ